MLHNKILSPPLLDPPRYHHRSPPVLHGHHGPSFGVLFLHVLLFLFYPVWSSPSLNELERQTEEQKQTHTHFTHFFWQKFGSGQNSSATHIQTLSLHQYLPPPLPIHLLHSHSPSQLFVSRLWRQTVARWSLHRSKTLVMVKQLSLLKSNI